jgi:hypothetical protein
MGFDSTPGKIEGPACSTVDDCEQAIGYHLNAQCIRGDSQQGNCVALCQYADDPAHMNCVTNPLLGLNQVCTRDQIRVASWYLANSLCADIQVTSWGCKPNARALTPDENWMVECMDQSKSCTPFSCWLGTGSPPEAKLGLQDYLDLLSEMISLQRQILPSGTGSSVKCSADCDCGHCGYCESGGCRYGGEGQFGCFRGCN